MTPSEIVNSLNVWHPAYGKLKLRGGGTDLGYFEFTLESDPDKKVKIYTQDFDKLTKEKPTNDTAGMKFDGGKLRFDLIPMEALQEEMKVLTHGANKYAPNNWKHVKGRIWRYVGAAGRHLMTWFMAYLAWWVTKDEKYRLRGKTIDDLSTLDFDTGISHMAHLACCAHFLTECERHPGDDEMEGYQE